MDFLRRLSGRIARSVPVKSAYLRSARPLVSVTFDDFPKSAWVNGGPILARYGARATYYTAGTFCGRTVDGTRFYDMDDLHALASAGHEIGCHGFGHQPTPQLDESQLQADVERNAQFLAPLLGGEAAASYAFPYGSISLRAKRFFARRYASARGVHPGINKGRVDFANLEAISLECRSWDQDAISRAIARARDGNAWIVFYTHEVCDRPSEYGTTPAMLAHVLDQVAAAGIAILPVREAAVMARGEAA